MQLKELTNQPPEVINQVIDSLSDDDIISMAYDWILWARPEQTAPPELFTDENKFIWMYLAGRGAGKTRSLGEFVIDCVKNKGYRRVSLIGATAPEVRTVIIEGESGLLNISPPDFMPIYEPSKKQIRWPNGAIANIFYGSEPELSRGAQSDLVWMDELCKWQYPEETYDNIMFGLRLGKKPLCCISTTPKPIKTIRNLMNDPAACITRGSTYDNKVNLAPSFITSIIKKYEGTRLGRQELLAEILTDNPGALWRREWIDSARVSNAPDCDILVIGVDPQAASPDQDGAETGIIAVGRGRAPHGAPFPELPHYYVFEDLTVSGTPHEWGSQAVSGYHKYRADRIIGERNNGGEMVRSTIHNVDREVPVDLVWASRGKEVRAEPISTLYEQGRVHHIGTFGALEDQLCEWSPGMKSPDRLDALVWGTSEIMGGTAVDDPITRQRTEKTRSRVRNLPI